MVGFNRRFAPMAAELKDFFKDCAEPFYVNYRVNAGYLPPSHWLNDPEQGGGRLIGEACHFIDFLCFIISQLPVEAKVESLPDQGKYSQDNFTITLKFEDGSIGIVAYMSNGNKRFGKEYIEVFNGGKIAILDDFRTLELIDQNKTIKKSSPFRQNKGHQAAWQAFLHAIRTSSPEPIPYDQLIHTSYSVLACNQSLLSSIPVDIQEFIQSR